MGLLWMLSNGDGDIARMLTEATHSLVVWASCVWLVWTVTGSGDGLLLVGRRL